MKSGTYNTMLFTLVTVLRFVLWTLYRWTSSYVSALRHCQSLCPEWQVLYCFFATVMYWYSNTYWDRLHEKWKKENGKI